MTGLIKKPLKSQKMLRTDNPHHPQSCARRKKERNMKYVLMQAPKTEDEYSSQIVIVDNSSKIGKGRVQKLINDGYAHIGYIESDLRTQQLKSGFEHDLRNKLDNAREFLNQINAITDSCYATML